MYTKFESKILPIILCHKFADFWQIERDRNPDGHDRTYGRTNIDFFGPPYTKSPFGAIKNNCITTARGMEVSSNGREPAILMGLKCV